ncbi:hypothetical protein [Buttiauxella noackiae]|uniref:hypothetical protein n=1 Tax=Buttiauxella noackiae TaxID=82992 RepID=UPI0028D63B5C|nr:hypothetical protein [Buttiauxella noackiae]
MHNLPAPNQLHSTNTLESIKLDAAIASRYACELKGLFDLHLDEKLRAANPQAGARFWTLINELYSTTGRIEMRIARVSEVVA